jgi:hypothetical protein
LWWKSIYLCGGLERVKAAETRIETSFGFGREQMLCLRSGGLKRVEGMEA